MRGALLDLVSLTSFSATSLDNPYRATSIIVTVVLNFPFDVLVVLILTIRSLLFWRSLGGLASTRVILEVVWKSGAL